MADIDFEALAKGALARAESLLAEWLPNGHKVGAEWKSRNPLREDKREGSFSVNCTTGAWADFAGGDDERGGDLVSLLAYLKFDGNQVESAKSLAVTLGLPDAIPPLDRGQKKDGKVVSLPVKSREPTPDLKAEEKPKFRPVLPVPEDAPPPPVAHEFRGIPQAIWTYRDAEGRVLGYVFRFVTSDGGKEIVPLTYCRHDLTGKLAWRWISFEDPRPLYGLDRLAAKPDATVMLVEGEKCADAGDAELPELVVVTWPGGGNAVTKVDFSPLAGRKVITWADCDSKRERLTKDDKAAGMVAEDKPLLPEDKQPGVKAMALARGILHDLGCKLWNVKIPKPLEKPDGWDVADMIAEGVTGEELADWIRAQYRPWKAATPIPISSASSAGAGERGRAPPDDEAWRAQLTWKKGELSDCLANVYDILANTRAWQGVLAYNEFSLRAVKLKPPPFANSEPGEWESVDDSRTAIWLTRQEDITPSSLRVMEAVETLARAHCFHPVRDYLHGLNPHDGIGRIDHWLTDFLGVADSPYVRLVSRWYLIGMIARVMEPGVKFDTCLVLEGKQGKGKSTALNILGGEFYDDTDLNLDNKDAMASLQGVWLHEFAELGSLAKAEASKQKSFLTRRVDKYRPVYGRRDIKAPRQTAFAGSVNDWEWQKDSTGGRRFWPVECGDLNLDGLRDNRDQLFAEALAAYLAKERFWPTPEEQKALFDPEQLEREQPDSYIDALHDWVYSQVADFSVATAIMDGLGLKADKLTRDTQTRVGIALRKLGCTRVEKRNGMVRYWYKPPTRNGVTSEAGAHVTESEGGHRAPF